MKNFKVKIKFEHAFANDSARRATSNKEYHYLSFVDLNRGDQVVVDTQYGLAVGVVTGKVRPGESFKGHSYVIQKIDTTAFQEMKQKQAKLEFLKAEIDTVVEEMTYESRIESFANNNPALAELLSQFKELNQ